MRSPEIPDFEYRPELEPKGPEGAPDDCLLDVLRAVSADELKLMSSCVSCDRCAAVYNPLENIGPVDQLADCAEVASVNAANEEQYRNAKGF